MNEYPWNVMKGFVAAPASAERSSSAGESTEDSPELREHVRRAAADLVDDLAGAEQVTRRWSHAAAADALVEAALDRCLKRLTATGCVGPANQVPSGELWAVAGKWLEKGSLQLRARMKPRGYAGDFDLLTAICEHATSTDPLGRALDRYFLAQAAPEAVRARTEAIAMTLGELRRQRPGGLRVVSVGAGPAIDVQWAFESMPAADRRGHDVTLLDIDPAALDHARGRIEPLRAGDGVTCIRTNLARLPGARNVEELLPPADLLVCAGMFDYLEAGAATKMLKTFYQRLAPGGLLLVGNFAPTNPTRAFMEWIGNWYLIYRTATDMRGLAHAAAIPEDCCDVVCEPTGIDLFLAAAKR